MDTYGGVSFKSEFPANSIELFAGTATLVPVGSFVKPPLGLRLENG